MPKVTRYKKPDSALGRQREADLYEFQVSLVYILSSKTARTVAQRTPVSKKQNKQTDRQTKEPDSSNLLLRPAHLNRAFCHSEDLLGIAGTPGRVVLVLWSFHHLLERET